MATAGVGIGPVSSTSMPTEVKPPTSAYLDHVAGQARVLADEHAVAVLAALVKTRPAAMPTFSASSGVITPFARPRMPSVPKYLRAMMSRSPAACPIYIYSSAILAR